MSLFRAQLRHELQLRYVGSLAGVYWSLINPLMQVGVYVLLVSVIFHARIPGVGGGLQYSIFLLSAMAAWLSMQEGLITCSTSLVRHKDIVKNIVFPLELLPAAAVVSSLISMGVSLIALVVMLIVEGRTVGISIVLFPVPLALQIALTLGLGLLLAMLTAFVRDVQFILPIVLQFLTLLTPIVYSLDNMPGPLRAITRFNPLYYLVAGYRSILFSHAWPGVYGLLFVAAVALAVLALGMLTFRAAKGYVEAFV